LAKSHISALLVTCIANLNGVEMCAVWYMNVFVMLKFIRSTLQFARDVKEAKVVADVASSIEAMSNSTQEVSISSRRGNIQEQGMCMSSWYLRYCSHAMPYSHM